MYPTETDAYIAEVDQARKKRPNLQDKQWTVDISDEFINELIKHEY